ncbi:hypothetical protein LAZ40_23030 [Cereibacter sphaeroides]|uniref:hypothetical protein n=1 Tax=Cereibacter sphaeroides TaxID=1063 RepID=UPI001F38AB3D|nr:hypothetical protein [Cereibacter sphaeroides]MCE6961915.1 hypothetical protein [Cereibacter sphaeroides]MCE6970690.1 hypothetical protein [Cereibacter sphaeroides]MCE6975714.1 hypothetical protein [Cereibacter sphaeroides]
MSVVGTSTAEGAGTGAASPPAAMAEVRAGEATTVAASSIAKRSGVAGTAGALPGAAIQSCPCASEIFMPAS